MVHAHFVTLKNWVIKKWECTDLNFKTSKQENSNIKIVIFILEMRCNIKPPHKERIKISKDCTM